jgi:hypothetical protein
MMHQAEFIGVSSRFIQLNILSCSQSSGSRHIDPCNLQPHVRRLLLFSLDYQ